MKKNNSTGSCKIQDDVILTIGMHTVVVAMDSRVENAWVYFRITGCKLAL